MLLVALQSHIRNMKKQLASHSGPLSLEYLIKSAEARQEFIEGLLLCGQNQILI